MAGVLPWTTPTTLVATSRAIMWLTVTFRGDKPDLRAILYAYITFSSLT